MKPFPFEAVYKKIAHAIMSTGIPKDRDMPPSGFVVGVMPDGDMKVVPMPPIQQFFVSPKGKAALGELVRKSIAVISAAFPESCAVIVSEAYMRVVSNPEKLTAQEAADRHRGTGSISSHPDSIEVIVIAIQTTTQSCVGTLKILPGRKLEFMPFKGVPVESAGNFTYNPDRPNRKEEA